jgi:hypothetical protein
MSATNWNAVVCLTKEATETFLAILLHEIRKRLVKELNFIVRTRRSEASGQLGAIEIDFNELRLAWPSLLSLLLSLQSSLLVVVSIHCS